jgi:hypothetical protein
VVSYVHLLVKTVDASISWAVDGLFLVVASLPSVLFFDRKAICTFEGFSFSFFESFTCCLPSFLLRDFSAVLLFLFYCFPGFRGCLSSSELTDSFSSGMKMLEEKSWGENIRLLLWRPKFFSSRVLKSRCVIVPEITDRKRQKGVLFKFLFLYRERAMLTLIHSIIKFMCVKCFP